MGNNNTVPTIWYDLEEKEKIELIGMLIDSLKLRIEKGLDLVEDDISVACRLGFRIQQKRSEISEIDDFSERKLNDFDQF